MSYSSPLPALRLPTLLSVAGRSAAVNLPLFGAVAACAIGVGAYFTRRGDAGRRRDFLKALAVGGAANATFLRFYRAADPIGDAVSEIGNPDRDPTDVEALRKALAATF